MGVQIVIARPEESGREWDGFLETHPQGSFYHRFAWMHLNQAQLGHSGIYLEARDGESITGVLPLVLTRSRIFGRILCSLPFVNYGGPVAVDAETTQKLIDVAQQHASRLGADIPFCLVGGRARVRGIGELVEPLDHVDRIVTLIIPPLAVSTPAAYRAWDDLGGPVADGPNDLEPAALVVEPELRHWRDRIADCVGTAPVLAGSGATWFVDGARANALGELVDEGARVVVARTVPMDVATGITPGV